MILLLAHIAKSPTESFTESKPYRSPHSFRVTIDPRSPIYLKKTAEINNILYVPKPDASLLLSDSGYRVRWLRRGRLLCTYIVISCSASTAQFPSTLTPPYRRTPTPNQIKAPVKRSRKSSTPKRRRHRRGGTKQKSKSSVCCVCSSLSSQLSIN